MEKRVILTLLSTKSAGSSAVQRYAAKNFDFSLVSSTAHQENETLYWTKAASILGYDQEKMVNSRVPIPSGVARHELESFLRSNGVGLPQHQLIWNEELLIQYFDKLARSTGSKFFEKSPHHLSSQSVVELILKAADYFKRSNIEFAIIGLVRHPHDVIYSGWSRWKYDPEAFENEWVRSNENLYSLSESHPELVKVFTYEEIIDDSNRLDEFFESRGCEKARDEMRFNNRSISKWMEDKTYGHRLRPDTIALAKKFGYLIQEEPHPGPLWNLKILYYNYRRFFVSRFRHLTNG